MIALLIAGLVIAVICFVLGAAAGIATTVALLNPSDPDDDRAGWFEPGAAFDYVEPYRGKDGAL